MTHLGHYIHSLLFISFVVTVPPPLSTVTLNVEFQNVTFNRFDTVVFDHSERLSSHLLENSRNRWDHCGKMSTGKHEWFIFTYRKKRF